ncbi:FAD:protein FMN transferase [Maribacter sp. CXY002]|uniref:FAD:protein FMN transferase n=1 Tax=Maribacter luteocoastalis TaxID=3407671 RepID=UPI003B66D3B4
MRVYLSIIFSLLMLMVYGQDKKYVTVKKSLTLMGERFDFTVVSVNEELAYINIQEAVGEIRRIEKLISSWDPESETSLINQNAGIKPVKVSIELFKLIDRSKQISEITNGAFDITFASMDKVWKFDGSMTDIPSKQEIENGIGKIGHQSIILDNSEKTVFLKKPGMKISFGAIGKGYAADRAKELLVSKKVVAGVINASGDITTWGTKATGEKWLIGIANPSNQKKVVSWLPILESSVAIAGSSKKYILFNGKKYSNIINPFTGIPTSGEVQVTVFAKSAELCDALATAILVMGKDAGLSLVNQLGGTEAIIKENETIYKSSGIILDQEP